MPNNDPDNRPTINQVVAKLNTIIFKENIQLSSKQQNISENITSPHWELSRHRNFQYCYRESIGTNINQQKAFELYQEAANLRNSLGINNLGYCYDEGIGIGINKLRAFELYQESANLGNVLGICNLAYFYEKELKRMLMNKKHLSWIKMRQI
ncbi:kinase-like domain-containing protein [Rhizophagus clarus]|uniref:Kinase-like domain-containing protein n=1 Tax=Rhizophagus clarus TaxID=94130 RepID=A0A8H3LQQ9_9GLOM|nr:kinase-like domain-containing protein [Rhizophagus clarus]